MFGFQIYNWRFVQNYDVKLSGESKNAYLHVCQSRRGTNHIFFSHEIIHTHTTTTTKPRSSQVQTPQDLHPLKLCLVKFFNQKIIFETFLWIFRSTYNLPRCGSTSWHLNIWTELWAPYALCVWIWILGFTKYLELKHHHMHWDRIVVL